MEIVLNNANSKYFEVISLKDLDNIHDPFNKVDPIKGPSILQLHFALSGVPLLATL